MQTTSTMHWNNGTPAKEHNKRNPDICSHEEHIDLANEHGDSYHEERFHQDLKEAYEEIFGDAIEEFNAKQTRKDRMKTVESYMDEVANDNRGKRQTKKVNGKRVIDEEARRGKQLEYEITVKVGNTERERDDQGRTVYDADGHHIRPEYLPRELQKSILEEYCDTFQDNNPNFHVTNIDIHADEGFYNSKGQWEYACMHPHITFIPVADGFKQGLSVQNSMNKALAAMGCGGTNGYDKWAKKEQERLETIMERHYKQYCIDHPDFYHEHGDLEIYHPVHDKLKTGDMEKEQFIKEQELTDREAVVKHRELQLDERTASFHEYYEKQSEGLDNMKNTLVNARNAYAIEKAEFEDYRVSEMQNIEATKKQQAEKQQQLQEQQQAIEADRNALDAEKSKFEAFRRAERQALEDFQRKVIKEREEAEQQMKKARGLYQSACEVQKTVEMRERDVSCAEEQVITEIKQYECAISHTDFNKTAAAMREFLDIVKYNGKPMWEEFQKRQPELEKYVEDKHYELLARVNKITHRVELNHSRSKGFDYDR